MLPPENQNHTWFQVSRSTIVHYGIIRQWHTMKLCNPSWSIDMYANVLATNWGVFDRQKTGTPPGIHTIPVKQDTRSTVHKTNAGKREVLSEKVLSAAISKATIISIISTECPDHACTRSLNFMGSAEALSEGVYEVLVLVNLQRFLRHVQVCPDPMCGAVVCIDGTNKVFREICGALLPVADESALVAASSNVHAVIAHGVYRQSVCCRAPSRTRRHNGRCLRCHRAGYVVSVSEQRASPSRGCTTDVGRVLRSANNPSDVDGTGPDLATPGKETEPQDVFETDDEDEAYLVWVEPNRQYDIL